MPPLERLRALDATTELLAVVVANLLPLLGILAFGWNVATIVAIYWFELAVMCFWALVRALFAGRPSEFDPEMFLLGALAERPVAIPIPFSGLEIRLSTLPVLAVAVLTLALVWFIAGTVTVGYVGDRVLESDAIETVTIAVFVLFLSEGARTGLEYFYRQGYREHSAQTAIQGVFWRGTVLFFVGLFGSLLAAVADPSVTGDDPVADVDPTIIGIPLLVGIVLLKFGFDLVGVYRNRLVAFDESIGGHLGFTYEPPTPEQADADLTDGHKRISPPISGRVLATRLHARQSPSAWFVGAFPAVLGILLAFSREWVLGVGLVFVGIALSVVLIHLDYWLRYAGVKYWVDGDAIVAYDRLFRRPLWRLEAWDENGVRVERDRIDDWLETATVIVERPEPDRDLQLPRLREPESVLEVFDRQPDGADVGLVGTS